MTLIEAVAEAQRSGNGFRRLGGDATFVIDEDGYIVVSDDMFAFSPTAADILATDWEMVRTVR